MRRAERHLAAVGRSMLLGIRRRGLATGIGLLRRTEPVSREFGFDRGLPVDRHYIETFLEENASVVRGRILEIGDSAYTHRFGGDQVTSAEVLNVNAGVEGTTYVADLTDAPNIPSDAFDCVVLTQTLHLVYDMPAAIRTVHRILRPGGTVLATVPGISQLASDGWEESWYWSQTPLAATRLFGDVFGANDVEVSAKGNVATAVAFLEGFAAHELRRETLATVDPRFPLLVTIRAVKPAARQGGQGMEDATT